mgnify:CR=1 FL=1
MLKDRVISYAERLEGNIAKGVGYVLVKVGNNLTDISIKKLEPKLTGEVYEKIKPRRGDVVARSFN